MLGGSADSTRDVQPRTDGGTRLTDLIALVHKPQINSRPAPANDSAKAIGKIPQELEVLLRTNPRPTGDDDSRAAQFDRLFFTV